MKWSRCINVFVNVGNICFGETLIPFLDIPFDLLQGTEIAEQSILKRYSQQASSFSSYRPASSAYLYKPYAWHHLQFPMSFLRLPLTRASKLGIFSLYLLEYVLNFLICLVPESFIIQLALHGAPCRCLELCRSLNLFSSRTLRVAYPRHLRPESLGYNSYLDILFSLTIKAPHVRVVCNGWQVLKQPWY